MKTPSSSLKFFLQCFWADTRGNNISQEFHALLSLPSSLLGVDDWTNESHSLTFFAEDDHGSSETSESLTSCLGLANCVFGYSSRSKTYFRWCTVLVSAQLSFRSSCFSVRFLVAHCKCNEMFEKDEGRKFWTQSQLWKANVDKFHSKFDSLSLELLWLWGYLVMGTRALS